MNLRKIKIKLNYFFIVLLCVSFLLLLQKWFILLTTSFKSIENKFYSIITDDFKRETDQIFYSLITNDGVCSAQTLKLNSSCYNELIKYTKHSKNECHLCSYDLKNNKITKLYHTIWQIDSENDDLQFRVLNLNIMSFLATQNLCCSRFILWKLRSFPQSKEEKIRKKFKTFFQQNLIEIRMFDLRELCPLADSFKNHKICKEKAGFFMNAIQLSDFVRFFILDAFGGIYTDGDFIYLSDLKPFWNFNFAYRWSYTDNMNNAVIGINKATNYNQLINKLVSEFREINQLIDSFNPFTTLSTKLRNLNNGSLYDYSPFLILHSYLFDSAWLCLDGIIKRLDSKSVCTFVEFSSTKFINESDFKINEFFPGSFGYHLHNINSHKSFSNESYFSYFENYFSTCIK